jgi:hypothetical protein
MTAAQIAEMTAMSEAETVALAYEEAVGGDVRRALQQAIKDWPAPIRWPRFEVSASSVA